MTEGIDEADKEALYEAAMNDVAPGAGMEKYEFVPDM